MSMRFAEVAVDAPAGYDRTFSYAIPGSLEVMPGDLVRVPFGRRTLQGVVFSLVPAPQVPLTRDILEVSSRHPVLEQSHLALARWMSRYYMCSLFEATAPMLPPGGRLRSRTHVAPGPASDEQSLTPFQQKVLEYVRGKGKVDQERVVRALGERAATSLAIMDRKGTVTRTTSWGPPPVAAKYANYAKLTPAGHLAPQDRSPSNGHRAPRQEALLTRLRESAAVLPLAHARKEFGASAVRALLAKGLIVEERTPVERDPLALRTFPPQDAVTLTPVQAAAAAEIRSALGEAPARTFLLHGVTGSGKTEVYLDAVKHCLDIGKRAIVLVSEIALTHQTVDRFGSRFQGRVAVLHSGLSPGQRFDQWWKIKRGDYGVVIGSRGAIFAPQPDLGLVVIDEEHEWTYKQSDAAPRYHTRDVALRMAELTGAVVVLGDASPDLDSYRRASSGEFRLLGLPVRVKTRHGSAPGQADAASLASVEVVDMRQELREGNRSVFSRSLADAMDDCLVAGDQMILFLNRRGSASHVQCRSCGSSLRCRRCEVAMTYHRGASRLICHYCGLRRTPPAKCPGCLSYKMSYHGLGTESVAAEASARLGGATVLRLDRDAASRPSTLEDVLSKFGSGQAQVLVGTQMVAKGLHFPGVSLVGVISADVGLNMPDHRAGERSFQLLYQVAGRAGRGSAAGKVIVQTYQPENYAIQAAAAQDYRRFYELEMAFRREHANPPFTKLIRLLYQHTNRAVCERDALTLADQIKDQRRAWGISDVEVIGPTPAYPARIRGRYRWHIILRGTDPRALLDKATVPTGWVVDVDPVSVT